MLGFCNRLVTNHHKKYYYYYLRNYRMSKYYSYLEVVSMANNLFLVVVKGKVALFDKKFMDWSSLHQLKVGQLQNDILTTYVLILRYEEHCKLKYMRVYFTALCPMWKSAYQPHKMRACLTQIIAACCGALTQCGLTFICAYCVLNSYTVRIIPSDALTACRI